MATVSREPRSLAVDLEAFRAKIDALRQRQREQGIVFEDADEIVCSVCKGAGFVVTARYDPTQHVEQPIAPCTACPADIQRQRQMRVAKRSGMEGFESKTFASTPALPGQEHIWKLARNYADSPDGWLLLAGDPYRGKSLLARLIANLWLDDGRAVIWRGTISLMDELRDASREDGRLSILREVFMHSPTLLLDDFARERPTPFVDEQMFEITDYRMERRLPSVVTCNLTMAELEQRNERLYARLADTTRCQVIEFTNERIER